jgi:tetratricopeptide (TPR) repeat protein
VTPAPATPVLLPATPVEAAPIVLPVPRADAAAVAPDDPSAIRLQPDMGAPRDVSVLGGGRDAESPPSLGGLPADLAAGARAGWAAYTRGDTKGARDALSLVAAEPHAPPWTSYVLGWADFAEGEFNDATAAWERVRRAAPAFEEVYFDLADSYFQQHQGAATLDVLHDAAGRWPQDVEVLNAAEPSSPRPPRPAGSARTGLGRPARPRPGCRRGASNQTSGSNRFRV